MNLGNLLFRATGAVARLPEPVGRGLFAAVGTVAGTLPLRGTQQLRRNLTRVRPDARGRAARRLTRAAMRSYMRYYYEALRLGTWEADDFAARVIEDGLDSARAEFARGHALIGALMHMGNWDMAGAWSRYFLAPVHTLVEKLEPAEVFERFVRLRENIGMVIYPVVKGGGAIHRLAENTRQGPILAPVLADRDLTASGVEVEFFGEKMLAAAGPAILAIDTGCAVVPIFSYYVKKERTRALPTRWRMVLRSGAPIRARVDAAASPRERHADIARITQEWITAFEEVLAEHPEDWHMLQPVFVADLDRERYRTNREKAARELARRQAEYDAKEGTP